MLLPPGQTRPRLLFIDSQNLGFATQSRQLRAATADRADLTATHLDVTRPIWIKLLGKRARWLGDYDWCAWRNLRLQRRRISGWIARADRADVVMITTQGFGLSMLDEQARCRRRGIRPARFALFVDCTARLEIECFGASPGAAGVMERVERRLFAAADLVVCMSAWAAHSVRRDYKVPDERIHVAPGCVDLPAEDDDEPSTGRLGVNASVDVHTSSLYTTRLRTSGLHTTRLPRVIWAGNDWRRKGGDLLLQLHQQHFASTAELHLYGAVPEVTGENVHRHGRVPRAQLLAALAAGDLFVLPTRLDMSPWVVLEAASRGLPVVAPRLAAIPEMVLDGQTGLLVDAAADGRAGEPVAGAGYVMAIRQLLDDPARRRQFGASAAAHVRGRYDPQVVYNRLLNRLIALSRE